MLNERNIPLEEDGIEEEILVDEEVAITKAMWGDVGGNIENQTDLKNALDAKQDSLTEAQLNAVNSGITSEKVTTYDGYADQIANKADQSALNTEATTREQADTALGRRIDDEATARQNADNGLQTQIDAITSKSDVVDVVANYAALQAYDTSTLGNNDVIKVLDDETHEDALTYYRWSTATQTWTYIGQEAPYYSKGQMDVMLQGKQDTLTAGANIQIENGTISATDTTYTAGNGLNLNGTEFSADTDVLATKEDLEGYYTKPETDNLLAPKLEAEVVAELPTTGEEGKLYLTPKAHTTQTATGNPITATVAEDAGQIDSFKLDGDTYQQSYEGKNLFNDATATNSYIQGNGSATPNDVWRASQLIKVEPNTSYTWHGEVYGVRQVVWAGYDSSQAFISGQYAQVNSVDSLTIITGENTEYLRVGYRSDGMRNMQLELGSTASDYEPFVGGQPSPSPDYPQQIQTVTGTQTVEIQGKNLFDGTIYKTGYVISAQGKEIQSSRDAVITNTIQVEPDTTYTASIAFGASLSDKYLRVAIYTSDMTFISRPSSPDAGDPVTFTTPSNARYIRLSFFMPATNAQVELGSTASDYAPYSKQTLPLDLGNIELCGIGDNGSGGVLYKDRIYKDGDDWKVHKDTGKEILQSSGWALRSDSTVTDGSVFRYLNYVAGKFPTNGQGLSSHFKVVAGTNTLNTIRFIDANDYGFNVSIANSAIGIESGDSSQTKAGKFMNWLSDNSVSVYYALVAPTDTVITDQTLIAQLEAIRTASLQNGTNTITNAATGTNLAGDMEIGYYGFAPRNRYDKWLWLDINNNYEQIGG